MTTPTARPTTRIYRLLQFADPRPAMVVAALSAGFFGVVVAATDVVGHVSSGPPARQTPLTATFSAVPGVLLGVLFVAASALLLSGLARERADVVRLASLGLLALWVYVWVTIPLANAVHGLFLPTAWARYTPPLVVTWWMYARSPAAAVRWPLPLRRMARRSRFLLPLVLVPPVVAIELTLPGDATGAVVVGLVTTILTLAAKALADRWMTKTDYAKSMLASATEKDALLWGVSKEEIARLNTDLEKLRAQFSAFLNVREEQDHFCRNTCPTYPNRPKG